MASHVYEKVNTQLFSEDKNSRRRNGQKRMKTKFNVSFAEKFCVVNAISKQET